MRPWVRPAPVHMLQAGGHRSVALDRGVPTSGDPVPASLLEARVLARHLPPVTAVAAALLAGVGLRLLEVSPLALLGAPALAIALFGVAPDRRAGRPILVGFLVVAVGGWLHADAAESRVARDCRWTLPEGAVELRGVVGDREGPGRFRLDAPTGLPDGCREPVRVVGRAASGLAPGTTVVVRGGWSSTAGRDAPDPLRAGVVLASSVRADRRAPGPGPRVGASWAARLRARTATILAGRLPREGALASALVVARRDGLDDDVRESFVRSGTVHLLAISGFHVGVVALLAVGTVRAVGGTRRSAAVAGATIAVTYAGVLGFPDAATRAALLVALGAIGRIVGRPGHGAGGLATALIVLVLADPAAVGRIGFQLSFAGAFGLALLARPLAGALRDLVSAGARALDRAAPHRALREGPLAGLVDGVAASAAATLLTFPLVAWHFESASLVGIPATLIAGPLVAAALPGLLAVVGLDLVGLPGAGLPAAGAEALLTATRWCAAAWAALPGAAVAVPRATVLAGGAGLLAGSVLLARAWGIARSVRLAAVASGVASALLLHPVADAAVRDRGLELHVLDVGQGDAIAVRTPLGRWLIVDTGPDPGDRLVRDLRGLGVRDVALMVLTHPDLDHLGGAAELLDAFEVRAVADPGTVRGTGAYREVLERTAREGAPWQVLSREDVLDVDGVHLRVLHPEPLSGSAGGPPPDPNDRSVVIRLEWRGFSALLTGDAPVADEEVFGPLSGPVDVLKVGHHGSRTSTGQALLESTRPAVALVSLGRFNRFGHPDPGVLERLARAEVPLHRTDLEGRLSVHVDRTGRFRVRTARARPN